MAHEAARSAVFACVQAQFRRKSASREGERNIAASRDEFLIRFALTFRENR